MAKSKVDTFLGFCVKSRKISLGNGAISTLKGGVYLLVLDKSAAENSKQAALKFKNRFSCPLLLCKSGFEDIINKPGCRIAAVRDGGLAKAILENLDDNYELYFGGSI